MVWLVVGLNGFFWKLFCCVCGNSCLVFCVWVWGEFICDVCGMFCLWDLVELVFNLFLFWLIWSVVWDRYWGSLMSIELKLVWWWIGVILCDWWLFYCFCEWCVGCFWLLCEKWLLCCGFGLLFIVDWNFCDCIFVFDC